MGNCETDWSRDVLERIVALLFALADLADLAACLPANRRKHLLGILGHGEAGARAFLTGVSAGAREQADMPASVADAIRLAARLRALALLLCALLAQPFALAGATDPRVGRPLHGIPGPAARWRSVPIPSAPDTS
jgi:hypothetical protein